MIPPLSQIRSGATGWAMVAMAVVLLGGCAASGSSDSASSSDATTANPSSSSPTSSSTQAAPATTPSPAPPGPLQTVQLYWHDIGAQNYEAAYRYLAPASVPQTAADFASQERQAQIQAVNFRGRLASASGSAATVDVNSLTTTDAQYGCRTWSGTYQLTRQAGTWLIAHANISPSPCPATQPPANTTGAGAGGGNTATSSTTGSGGCSPLTDSGGCYEPGEYCRGSDHGMSGVAGDGEGITCEDNNGWRWEPS